MPLAVLANSGDVILWQFDRGAELGEAFETVFARIAAGSQAVLQITLDSLKAIEPNGQQVLIRDGDCTVLRSQGLVPQRGPFLHSAATALLPSATTSNRDWEAVAGLTLYY